MNLNNRWVCSVRLAQSLPWAQDDIISDALHPTLAPATGSLPLHNLMRAQFQAPLYHGPGKADPFVPVYLLVVQMVHKLCPLTEMNEKLVGKEKKTQKKNIMWPESRGFISAEKLISLHWPVKGEVGVPSPLTVSLYFVAISALQEICCTQAAKFLAFGKSSSVTRLGQKVLILDSVTSAITLLPSATSQMKTFKLQSINTSIL